MKIIEIQPSRLLATLLVAVHAAAAFSFVLCFPGVGVRVSSLAVILASLCHALWRNRRGLGTRLGLREEGGLVLLELDGAEVDVALLPASVVLGAAVWLVWRVPLSRRRGAVLILEDQLSAMNWRALQVWVRLRARPGVAAEPEGERA